MSSFLNVATIVLRLSCYGCLYGVLWRSTSCFLHLHNSLNTAFLLFLLLQVLILRALMRVKTTSTSSPGAGSGFSSVLVFARRFSGYESFVIKSCGQVCTAFLPSVTGRDSHLSTRLVARFSIYIIASLPGSRVFSAVVHTRLLNNRDRHDDQRLQLLIRKVVQLCFRVDPPARCTIQLQLWAQGGNETKNNLL